jgi:hypothetical protein
MNASSPGNEGELSAAQLELVVAGLARAWQGNWDPAETGEPDPLAPRDDPAAVGTADTSGTGVR